MYNHVRSAEVILQPQVEPAQTSKAGFLSQDSILTSVQLWLDTYGYSVKYGPKASQIVNFSIGNVLNLYNRTCPLVKLYGTRPQKKVLFCEILQYLSDLKLSLAYNI